MRVKEFKFKELSNALRKAEQMKDEFGYEPNIIKLTHPISKKKLFIVVRPYGLRRMIK